MFMLVCFLGLGTGAQRQYKVYWLRQQPVSATAASILDSIRILRHHRPPPGGEGAPPEAPPEGPPLEALFYAIWLH